MVQALSTRAAQAISVAFAMLTLSCGGGDGGPTQPPPPPPPAPVASVTVTPGEATVLVGATVQLTATTFDATGATLTGRTVTWSTADATIASVVDGLVTGVGAGTVLITATSEGQSGSATVTVNTPDFEPTGDTNLSGAQSFTTVNIPAGVTVTVDADLTMAVSGAVSIAGTLAGNCVDITINGQSTVAIQGAVNNGCADGQSETADLTIVGNGDLTLTDASFEVGGAVTIINDPTLTEAEFATGGAPAATSGSSQAGTCTASNTVFLPKPSQAKTGADGQNGENGEDGKTWVLMCRGDAILAGGVRVFGQDGGGGGRGLHNDNKSAEAVGGLGGHGGDLKLLATGTWQFTGTGNELIAGDGGIGGFARAEGLQNPDIDPAASAVAQSGDGGDGGIVEVRSLSSIAPLGAPGVLTIQVGAGGAAADAVAIGAHGLHSDQRPGKPAQAGGSVLALGGFGGNTPDLTFRATGAASTANVTVTGADGGDGGLAHMDAGDGGNGDVEFKNGASGGSVFNAEMDSNGGNGGDALTKDAGGNLIGNGGRGGKLEVTGGNGGFGFDGCAAVPITSGGDGGSGGFFSGNDGPGGTGKAMGDPGGVEVFEFTGMGGDGLDGEPLWGFGGGKGQDGIAARGPRTNTGRNFEDGIDGKSCHTGIYDFVVSVLSDPAHHHDFIQLLNAILSIDLAEFFPDLSAAFSATGSFPFVDVTGTRDAEGNVTATGIGTVAGFPGISVSLTGLLFCNGTFDFEYIMGVLGGLPSGLPITYGLTGTMQGAAPASPRARRTRRGLDDQGSPARSSGDERDTVGPSVDGCRSF